jgi:type IV secretory pathway ATPase VirB11/archaellum biosynthesis ATPase
MTIEQTIEIPDSHRVYVDLPPQIPVGKARIAIRIIEYSGADNDIEAFSDEAEATEFATRLSKRIIHEAW